MPLFLTSRLLSSAGVVHGFSTRRSGVSSGPFASLNVSTAVGDDGAHVAGNLARLARAAGADAIPFATVTQVHGDRVLLARLADGVPCFDELLPESDPGHESVSGERGPANANANGSASASAAAIATATETETATSTAPPSLSADAVLVTAPGLLAAVRVADCVPILLHDPRSGASAAVHSGWRGSRLSIAARGVQALSSTSRSLPGDVLAAIGPCIGRCCYEVSPELATMFRALFGDAAADDPARVDRPHLDLRACVAAALLAAGVPLEHLEQVPGCTSCEAERFFSHRRDRGVTGRMLGFIAAR